MRMTRTSVIGLMVAGLTCVLVVFSVPRAVCATTDEEVRIVREIEELRETLATTEWTWWNRDQKKPLEDRIALLTRILDRVAQRGSELRRHTADGSRRHKRGSVANEEVQLIREAEEIREEIRATEWTWSNRDLKTVLQKRLDLVEQILSRSGP
jgi:hypothetical protein